MHSDYKKNPKPKLHQGMAYGMLAGVEPVVGIYTGKYIDVRKQKSR